MLPRRCRWLRRFEGSVILPAQTWAQTQSYRRGAHPRARAREPHSPSSQANGPLKAALATNLSETCPLGVRGERS
jgi:hypothetical protein